MTFLKPIAVGGRSEFTNCLLEVETENVKLLMNNKQQLNDSYIHRINTILLTLEKDSPPSIGLADIR